MGCCLNPNFLLPPARYHGILVVIATLIVYIPIGGQLQSFGVFVEKLNEDFCPKDCMLFLSWIGALTFGINRLCCWIIVSLQKRLSTCLLFFVGVILASAAMALSSLVTDLSWLFLTYCVLFGVGSSMVMNSPYDLIESYFPTSHRHYILATSVMNVGSPVGSILMNPLSAHLDKIERHTWRDTMMIYAVLMLVVGLLCCVVMRRRVGTSDEDDDQTPAKYEDLNKSTEKPNGLGCTISMVIDIHLWTIAILFLSFAIYIPKIHFIQYLETLHFDLEEAALCMSYAGAAEAILSLVVALLGDALSNHLMFVYAAGCACISVASSFLVVSINHIYIPFYCIVHGATDGVTMTLLFSAMSLLSPTGSLKKYIWSGTYFVNGLGQILGIPLAGYVYDHTKSYKVVFLSASGVFGVSTLLFLILAVRLRLRHVRLDRPMVEKEIVMPSPPDTNREMEPDGPKEEP